EKPPVASLDDFTSLLQVQQETGRAVQVGFQSLGSRALEILTEDALGIGDLVRVSAVGPWSHDWLLDTFPLGRPSEPGRPTRRRRRRDERTGPRSGHGPS